MCQTTKLKTVEISKYLRTCHKIFKMERAGVTNSRNTKTAFQPLSSQRRQEPLDCPPNLSRKHCSCTRQTERPGADWHPSINPSCLKWARRPRFSGMTVEGGRRHGGQGALEAQDGERPRRSERSAGGKTRTARGDGTAHTRPRPGRVNPRRLSTLWRNSAQADTGGAGAPPEAVAGGLGCTAQAGVWGASVPGQIMYASPRPK